MLLAGPNVVYDLTGFTNTGSGVCFGLFDTASLSIAGPLNTGPGQLWLTDTHYVLCDAPTVVLCDAPTVSGGVGFMVGDDRVRVNAGLSVAGGLSIYAGNGGIVEVGGTITTPSLVRATSGAIDLPGANRIGSLGSTVATGDVFLTKAEGLTVTGPISSGAAITLGTTSGALTTQGTITGGGAIYLYAADLLTLGGSVSTPGDIDLSSATRDIVLKAAVSGAHSVTLNSAGASYELPGGSISNALLNVTAGSGIDLNGPNRIGHRGIDHTGSGPNQIHP